MLVRFVSKTGLVLSLASILLLSGALIPAFAAQLDSLLIPNTDKASGTYRSVDVFYIEYPDGGKLKSMLEGVRDDVRFTVDKNDPGVKSLTGMINKNLLRERNSPVSIEIEEVEFRATLKGESDRAVLEHVINMDFVLTGFVLRPGTPTEGALIDMNWRGFMINEPATISTQEFGEIDINLPSGYFYARQPEVMSLLENSEASSILNQPTLDYTEFVSLTLDRWHRTFDPTGSIVESEAFGFQEVGGARAVTFYAAGESSIREGIQIEKTTKIEVAIDGDNYIVRSTKPPTAASIQVLGFANTEIQGTDEAALVFENPPEGAGQAYSGGFPIVVLAVLGGMLAAVAGFVLWRVNKK